jgi:uncharacterized protein (TIGR02996 family)
MPKPSIQSDIDAFMATICAHPEDDTPRLIFADWLEERDQVEYAQFIRDQIEEANLDFLDPRRGALRLRTMQESIPGRDELLQSLPKWTQKVQHRFYRGFPSEWHPAMNQLKSLPGLRKKIPLDRVQIWNVSGRSFENPKLLEGLTSIDFLDPYPPIQTYGDRVIECLVSGHCRAVRNLVMPSCSSEKVRDLTGSGALESLESLTFRGPSEAMLNAISPEGSFRNLRRLNAVWSERSIEDFIERKIDRQWESLAISNFYSTSGLTTIPKTTPLPLRALRVRRGSYILELMDSGYLNNLEYLYIGEVASGEFFLEQLFQEWKLPKLRFLSFGMIVSQNPIRTYSAPKNCCLELFSLGTCNFDEAEIQGIAGAVPTAKVSWIDFDGQRQGVHSDSDSTFLILVATAV